MFEQFANYFLLLSLTAVSFFLIRGRSSRDQARTVISRKFLFLGWAGILIAVFLVFRSIFSSGPVVWGDAPYFPQEAFKNFFAEPLVWEARGRLGVVNDLYWIYPLMFVYRGLGVLGLDNSLVIRLVFYFPALFFAVLSPWFFTRYLGFSTLVSIFSVLVYALSTYFILVIDGGQVGVALAYGVFPFALLQLIKLKDSNTFLQFYLTLAVFMLLVAADVRFALISIFTYIVWLILFQTSFLGMLKLRFWKTHVLFILAVLGLSAYWLIPVLSIEPTTGSGTRSGLELVSVLNPLFLYSPHWPQNEFGKISSIPWHFAGVPFLIFAGLFFTKTKKVFALIFCFLLFAFLVKGETGLLGVLYSKAVDTIPLGGAFRDSTKFFAPLTLIAGILIGLTVDNLRRVIKKKIFSGIAVVSVFIYLLYLISPALLQNMHGVLAKKDFPESIKVINDKIAGEKEFLRTVWFPERHPLTYHTETKPALDAKSLVSLRPFAALNTGTQDVFNFLNNDESVEWFRLTGVKYLAFIPDPRKINLNNEEQEDWNQLLGLVESKKWLNKIDRKTEFPVYEIKDPKPRIYGLTKAVIVVGGDDIYSKLESKSSEFSVQNQGFIFVEDGKTEPEFLTQIASGSAVLVLNNKNQEDLNLSFLQKYFVSPNQSSKSEWAVRGSGDYLRWKYELLVNNIQTREFDFGQGVAFSSQRGEKINFRLSADISGDYVLAVRSMTRSEEGLLKGQIENNNFEVPQKTPGQFGWYIQAINLSKGTHELVLENTNGFQVVNTVSLIPRDKWLSALEKARELTDKIEVISVGTGGSESLEQVLGGSWQKVEYEEKSPVEYKINVPDKVKWIVFTDNYHRDWELINSDFKSPFPFYSMVNGFFVPSQGQYKIVFSDQKSVRPGLYLSLLSLVIISGLYLIQVLVLRMLNKSK
ncbi:MAG: hypothetical protein A3F61_00610 [Candidatus Blackburnbacteria bacterium RIFCSPHIGHO2_12_FULL_41_13b]|uniref:Membrane protein 6-pyruvoyl-tetrahydropterin synthase-related domain-containing protein n=1 Tax=Candidatus Blackburnbacteria bacterium RIFCSPHIGHO2_12_FULL_41_13b TaxID=1797517 RepID=A0A1G1VCF8_9BACT|nr:MAG: hypothetical protein A3F61_00610 [Candidatus Blackburnbacteria bacterium RIFCSPHIGHO2_12_FULL_41_13b]